MSKSTTVTTDTKPLITDTELGFWAMFTNCWNMMCYGMSALSRTFRSLDEGAKVIEAYSTQHCQRTLMELDDELEQLDIQLNTKPKE